MIRGPGNDSSQIIRRISGGRLINLVKVENGCSLSSCISTDGRISGASLSPPVNLASADIFGKSKCVSHVEALK